MKTNEIIDTLRVCADGKIICQHCPRYEKYTEDGSVACFSELMQEAADALEAALREQEERENPQPLTLDELKQLSLKEWVWVEVLQKISGIRDESAYYRKCLGWMPENTFFCGYPGWATAFDYADYGKTWLAYRSKPKE